MIHILRSCLIIAVHVSRLFAYLCAAVSYLDLSLSNMSKHPGYPNFRMATESFDLSHLSIRINGTNGKVCGLQKKKENQDEVQGWQGVLFGACQRKKEAIEWYLSCAN